MGKEVEVTELTSTAGKALSFLRHQCAFTVRSVPRLAPRFSCLKTDAISCNLHQSEPDRLCTYYTLSFNVGNLASDKKKG
jgi:hypothetical protein